MESRELTNENVKMLLQQWHGIKNIDRSNERVGLRNNNEVGFIKQLEKQTR